MTVGDESATAERLAEENARLRAQLETVERYTALTLARATRRAQVISVLGHDVALDTLVDRTSVEIAELFAADIAVFMLGPDDRLTVEGHWGVRDTDVPTTPFAAPPLPGLSHASPVLAGPVGEVPVPTWLQRYGPRHVAWARLAGGDTSQGLLLLARRAPVPYDDAERRELRAIATRVAMAIDNGLLHRRMRRQIDRGQRLQQLITELAGILELDQIATRLSEILVEEVPVTASVIQVERDGELVPLVGTQVRPPPGDGWTQFPLEASGKRVGRIDVAGAPAPGSGGYALLQHLIGLAAIAIDKALIYAQIQEQARHDSLTGLLSHRVFHEMLERMTARPEPFSIVLVDIDDFKQVNDFHGHQTGDQALCAVATALRHGLRMGDSVFRIGGEEFCVVLPGLAGHDAWVTAERLRQAVARLEAPLPVTISLGVAGYPDHATTRTALLSAADAGLYTSKRTGKNRTTVAGGAGPSCDAPVDVTWLLDLLYAKDPAAVTRGDASATLAVEMGRLLGVADGRLGDLRTAARLHDVGKIGVPDAVVRKAGPLTAREWEAIRTVPLVGAELVRARGLTVAARFIAEHRERIDGTGYPRGLGGGAIARESQIVHVASAYTALRSARADRPAHSPDDAIARLRRLRHGGVDADVVEQAVVVASGRPAPAT